ncbi:MAG: carboxymuconolactone decarboxylase family protein [Nitrospirae bacterium]|nr:carboxymuconolactone decarboxylase family protein [Nitrospirota bacterium]
MSTYPFHTQETAPEAVRPVLQAVKGKFGFVPNLIAGLANAPAALGAYLAVADAFEGTSLTPVERQVVLLATSVDNGCPYCVAAHSMIARKMAGAPDPVVDAMRCGGALADPKLAALADFARAVVRERGHVADSAEHKAFLAAGYTPAQALEVVVGVTQKTLSNYANRLLGTPVDAAFADEAWTPA